MVDSILSRMAPKPGMVARLKITTNAQAPAAGAPSSTPESRLSDLLDLSADAKTKLSEGRKLDAYLRTFSSALKLFSGFGWSGYKPVTSTVEIEYVEAKNPYKIDTKA